MQVADDEEQFCLILVIIVVSWVALPGNAVSQYCLEFGIETFH